MPSGLALSKRLAAIAAACGRHTECASYFEPPYHGEARLMSSAIGGGTVPAKHRPRSGCRRYNGKGFSHLRIPRETKWA